MITFVKSRVCNVSLPCVLTRCVTNTNWLTGLPAAGRIYCWTDQALFCYKKKLTHNLHKTATDLKNSKSLKRWIKPNTFRETNFNFFVSRLTFRLPHVHTSTFTYSDSTKGAKAEHKPSLKTRLKTSAKRETYISTATTKQTRYHHHTKHTNKPTNLY